MNIDKVIKYLIKKISSKLTNFKGVYFYGSRAKGTNHPESDYDMIFVFRTRCDFTQARELTGIIIDAELENDIFIDHHPMTKEELEKNPLLYNEVVHKGLFYAAV